VSIAERPRGLTRALAEASRRWYRSETDDQKEAPPMSQAKINHKEHVHRLAHHGRASLDGMEAAIEVVTSERDKLAAELKHLRGWYGWHKIDEANPRPRLPGEVIAHPDFWGRGHHPCLAYECPEGPPYQYVLCQRQDDGSWREVGWMPWHGFEPVREGEG
jgi:hypothetical protein